MIEDQRSNNENSIDNDKCTIQHEFKESESVEKSEIYATEERDKSTENTSYFNSNNEQKGDIESNKKRVNYENETVQHSDNDNENIVHKSLKGCHKESEQNDNQIEKKHIHNNWFRIVDSDSEEENLFISKSKSKICMLNKSEDGEAYSDHDNKSEKYSRNKGKSKKFLDNDSNNAARDSDLEEAFSNDSKAKNRFQRLIDSESDEGERTDNEEQSSPTKYDKKAKKYKKEDSKSQKRKVSLRASKEEAMRQIQNETQRLIRESEISLPYHKPKQRTLQEFLNRKKVITALPKAPTMAAKLKMSSAIVHEVLKEKEKEAEIFYKSSDSEEETDKANKEHEKVEGTQDSKKDKVSRKLFVDINQATPEDSTDKSNISTIAKMHNYLTGIEETLNNERTENCAGNSTTLEQSCKSSSTDNRDEGFNIVTETDRSSKVDNFLGKDVGEKEIEKENILCNGNEHGLEIINELSDGTSNAKSEYAKMVKRSLGIAPDGSDEYDEYGLPPPNFDNSSNVNEKKALLNITNLKPQLRGSPGTLIDLSDDTKNDKGGMSSLLDRFVSKHSNANGRIKDFQKVITTQIKQTPNGLSIVKETLPYRLPSTAHEDPKWNKPGAKLLRLKEDLKQKMALKRDEEWKQREQDMKEQEIEWNESIIEEDDINVPFSPSIESHRSEEDELEEDDVCNRKEKKRKRRNAFIDDEAEVSEDGVSENDEIEDDDDDDDSDEVQENSDRKEECEKTILYQEDEHSADDHNDAPKCKMFKRIVEPLDDDSRSSNVENIANKDKIASFSHISDMFGKRDNQNVQNSDNESDIPIAQTDTENDLKQQMSLASEGKNNTFDFVSPLTQLTALNANLDDEKEPTVVEKSLIDQILIGSTQVHELSQEMHDLKNQANSHKPLFIDQDKNVLDDELMEIASGKFTEDKNGISFSKEPNVSESQLLELCSGAFSSQTNEKDEMDFSDDIPQSTQVSRERDSLHFNKDEQQSHKHTASWNKLCVVSSDDEDFADEYPNKRSKKRIKKLDLSDDEEESNSVENSDDEDVEDYHAKYVDYDSEENEVVVPQKDIKKYAARFLEEEAELSESDCEVSADEDEDDLDKLEFVDVDDEEIDEAQIKNQLGKLHVKQLLDEDQKEVRMLKELLFEDGDLHSESGRERKFKWKNIDKQDDNNDPPPLEDKDGLVDVSDDEDEVKWRQIRHEREKFLAEKTTNIESDIENDLNDSEVFKFGLKILKKRRIDESQKQDTSVESLESKADSRIPHTIAEMLNSSTFGGKSVKINSVMQKRSFLAKGEETLARLATLARQKEAPVPSNAKRFIFAHVDIATGQQSASTAGRH